MKFFKNLFLLIPFLVFLVFVSCREDLTGIVQGNVYDDATDDPLGGVKVTIDFSDASCITSSKGFYELKDLRTYSRKIFASKSGYENYSEVINVTAGVNTHNIYMSPYPGTVKGYVYFVNDTTPISGVSISCGEVSTSSSGEGSYELNNVPSGSQILSATKSDFEDYRQTVDIPQDDTLNYNIYMTSSTSAPNLYGYVYSELDGYIQSAKVKVAGLTDWTDASGRYQIPNIPQGVYTINVTHDDYITFEDSVYLYSSDKQYDVRMLRPDTLVVYVTEDAYISNESAADDTICFGVQDSTNLIAKYYHVPGSPRYSKKVFINFNIDEVPTTNYDSVHIKLNVYSYLFESTGKCKLVKEIWEENTINYSNAPTIDDAYDYYPDVTDCLTKWLNNPYSYHGFVILFEDIGYVPYNPCIKAYSTETNPSAVSLYIYRTY